MIELKLHLTGPLASAASASARPQVQSLQARRVLAAPNLKIAQKSIIIKKISTNQWRIPKNKRNESFAF
jgi:hypothetical protein